MASQWQLEMSKKSPSKFQPISAYLYPVGANSNLVTKRTEPQYPQDNKERTSMHRLKTPKSINVFATGRIALILL